ncbi:unnamed protein product [Pleuronectes platessa]|uniref:Uncharacterized protein n=1 Tax=Pleuronectes platessa TaxID=8262 RepID=A0A9N7UM82_PLEPL|nr:unnamed protein product [Pleuronectes platessa]
MSNFYEFVQQKPGVTQRQCSDSHNPSSTPISPSPEKNIHHLSRIPMTMDCRLCQVLLIDTVMGEQNNKECDRQTTGCRLDAGEVQREGRHTAEVLKPVGLPLSEKVPSSNPGLVSYICGLLVAVHSVIRPLETLME